jgi:tetratricopeptide (TPR) repeat protein/predicted Ser/Thr protein kinase
MTLAATADDDRENQLNEVLAAYLRAMHEGLAPTRQSLLAQHPTLADELARFFADQDHVERLAAPLRRLMPSSPLVPGRVLGDYELLEEVAHGGMGVVFKARQRSLNRIVAVKVLRVTAASPSSWQRFRVEAEAVAHLDHPNIVPIYEVGECEDLPFFSMKLVEGGSLAENKARFRSDLRSAAHLVATVARAVQHAHERGILHRDLKPSNVLVDRQGQPYVTDFGLAKRLTVPAVQDDPAGGPQPTEPAGVSAIVGTPAYMAPEQALGQPPTIAADVWGLGALLYELLTGQAPFAGVRRRRVSAGPGEEPPAPRSIEPRVDRDLEAICRTCLSRDPKARYASARDLADDLDRYLAGQPVRVRAVGRLRRFGRWCRRQPVIAGLSAALLVLFVTAFGLVWREWRRAERNFEAQEKARAQAEEQWRRAEHNLDRVEAILDDFGMRLTEKQLASIPGLQPARKQFLEAALRHYQDVLAQRGDDPHLRAGVAAAYSRIAQITSAIGSKKDALAACLQAVALYDELCAQSPDDASLGLACAQTLHWAGLFQTDVGRPQDAMDSYSRARTLLEKLHQDPAQGRAARSLLGSLAVNLGNQYFVAGRLADAQASYEEAVHMREALLEEEPRSRQSRYGLATALDNLGNVQGQRGDRTGCHRSFERARRLLEELNGEGRDDGFREQLARILIRISSLQSVERQYEQAIDTLKPGIALLAQLVRDNPRVLSYQDALSTAYRQIGHAFRDKGQSNEAAEHYREAISLSEKIHLADPSSSAYRRNLARGCFDLATVLPKQNRTEEAVRWLTRACDHFRTLAASKSSLVEDHRSLTMALNNLTVLQHEAHPTEALAAVREASEQGREALRLAPNFAQHRELLSSSYRMLADLELQVGRPDNAAAAARACHDLYPDNPTHLYKCARFLAQAADALDAHKELSATEQASRDEWRDRAVQFLHEAIQRGLPDPGKQTQDKAFNALRRREDFRRLVEPSKPSAAHGP